MPFIRLTTSAALIAITATSATAQTATSLCYSEGQAYSIGSLIRQAGQTLSCRVASGEVGASWTRSRVPSSNYCEMNGEVFSSGAEIVVAENRRLSCCGGTWTNRRGTCDLPPAEE